MIAHIITPLAIGWPNGTGPTEDPTVIAQIMRTLGIGWHDVIFFVLLLAFCSLLSVLAYQQAINHIVWFIYPLLVSLMIWGAIRLLGWRIPVIAYVSLPLLAVGLIGVHFSVQSTNNRTARIEVFRRVIEEVTVNPDREISREVYGLAEIVLNGSKAEVTGSSRTLASMTHTLTESERRFLLRLMDHLLAREHSWRWQAANDLILAIKTSQTASATGRSVNLAYQSDATTRHLQQQLIELEGRYETLSKRIAALEKDLDRALDSETKLILEERRRDLVAERNRVADDMACIQLPTST